jgi:hypothetical protein
MTIADHDAAACDLAALHLRLARHHHRRLTPSVTGADLAEEEEDRDAAAEWERFIARERWTVRARAAAAPTDPDAFIAWFESLAQDGPGQGDGLFPWLAAEATLEDFLWFLRQELAGEAGFDDLVALTQVKMPRRAKMEMARNLWDEFGRGNPLGVHGALLDRLAGDLGLAQRPDAVVWESLALSNLMVGMALSRRHAFQSVGALGVIEMTAPGRVAQVNAGLRRLGVPPATRLYYELHASLDVQHSKAWNREVLRPLVAEDPRTAVPLAEGALMRLEAGRRCFAAYRTHFSRVGSMAA